MNVLALLRVGFAWTSVVANTAVSSCLAFSSLLKTTQGYSGYFLLHFPSSRLDLPLASTLLCEARTFLKLSITLNLRPFDQADDYILTRNLNLSIPFLKILTFFLKIEPKTQYIVVLYQIKERFCGIVCCFFNFFIS